MAEIVPPQTPADAMALLERRLRFDPDLWIVEAEDGKGRFPLDGPIIG